MFKSLNGMGKMGLNSREGGWEGATGRPGTIESNDGRELRGG